MDETPQMRGAAGAAVAGVPMARSRGAPLLPRPPTTRRLLHARPGMASTQYGGVLGR